MKPIFILSLLATTATAIPPIPPLMDISATKCGLTGSGSVVCRSCPSLNYDKMAMWNPGNSVNVNCMCHGQMQGGVDSWLYVKNKDCYIRQPRTDCCENCMPIATTAPAQGITAAVVGGGEVVGEVEAAAAEVAVEAVVVEAEAVVVAEGEVAVVVEEMAVVVVGMAVVAEGEVAAAAAVEVEEVVVVVARGVTAMSTMMLQAMRHLFRGSKAILKGKTQQDIYAGLPWDIAGKVKRENTRRDQPSSFFATLQGKGMCGDHWIASLFDQTIYCEGFGSTRKQQDEGIKYPQSFVVDSKKKWNYQYHRSLFERHKLNFIFTTQCQMATVTIKRCRRDTRCGQWNNLKSQ